MSVNSSSSTNTILAMQFFLRKGWVSHQCSGCGNIFFLKTSARPVLNCGWHSCDTKEYRFRNLSKRKSLLKPAEVATLMSTYFQSAGFSLQKPLPIANHDGKTDLVIAGVQVFDPIIHQNRPLKDGKLFIAQPCVRMQFQSEVETQEGTSTSFVNVCTENMGATFEQHLENVDNWCTILSKLGLHMNDFIIVMRHSQNDWGTGAFEALELFFTYAGLELGDAAFLNIPQQHRASISISDIGFGLERIAWAINKTDSYFDILIPWTHVGKKEMFDACRTIALLGLCGVQAGNKGPGLQVRRFAKVLAEKYCTSDLFDLLPHYFNYWQHFVPQSIKTAEAGTLVRMEIERFVNLRICELLGAPPPRDELTDAYLDRLVYTHRISIEHIRNVMQKCKTQ